jgi:hypothetical protein
MCGSSKSGFIAEQVEGFFRKAGLCGYGYESLGMQ